MTWTKAELRRARLKAENTVAIRAAITPAITAAVAGAEPDTEYPAGERLELRAGTRRTIKVDEGELYRLALADALEARGVPIRGLRMTAWLMDRGSIRYGVIL